MFKKYLKDYRGEYGGMVLSIFFVEEDKKRELIGQIIEEDLVLWDETIDMLIFYKNKEIKEIREKIKNFEKQIVSGEKYIEEVKNRPAMQTKRNNKFRDFFKKHGIDNFDLILDKND